MDITIDIDPRLKEFSGSRDFQRIVREEYVKAMRESTVFLAGDVKPETPFAFGILRNSILPHTLVSNGDVMGFVTTPVTYAQPVEEGSRPHWAPIEPLKLWAKRKLGDESIAFRVQRAIARHGTRAHKMFERTFQKDKDKVFAAFDRAVDRMLRKLRSL